MSRSENYVITRAVLIANILKPLIDHLNSFLLRATLSTMILWRAVLILRERYRV